jgi:glycine hydroxymethyltransferase
VAVAFKIAAPPRRSGSVSGTIDGTKAVADALLGALRESELDGLQAEDRLHDIDITVNRNAVPFDPRPPMVTSGLRVGTSALATRGLQDDDFREVGDRSPPRSCRRSTSAATTWPNASPRSPTATPCTSASR